MTWDTGIKTVTFGGSATGKMKAKLKKYEDGGKTLVLAVCKTSGNSGPSGGNCGPPIFQPCRDNGS
ncbi:MAG: hypothetical protein GY850_45360 [bacterium]|nr:hypothetical protein [bacterium]